MDWRMIVLRTDRREVSPPPPMLMMTIMDSRAKRGYWSSQRRDCVIVSTERSEGVYNSTERSEGEGNNYYC